MSYPHLWHYIWGSPRWQWQCLGFPFSSLNLIFTKVCQSCDLHCDHLRDKTASQDVQIALSWAKDWEIDGREVFLAPSLVSSCPRCCLYTGNPVVAINEWDVMLIYGYTFSVLSKSIIDKVVDFKVLLSKKWILKEMLTSMTVRQRGIVLPLDSQVLKLCHAVPFCLSCWNLWAWVSLFVIWEGQITDYWSPL